MEELINTLGQESEQYERLLSLSLKKTPVIVSADLEALSLITDEEQVILSRLANIEKKREECMKDIANVVNRDVSTLKLGDLIAMLNTRPQEQQKLAVLHDKLSTTIAQMRRSNEQNRQLIESSLEMVQFDMNVIQAMKAAPETANYTRNAYASGDVMGVSSGRFDSKS
ncbi:MAG: flagellar protein FlgN [Lachnospiraceae bacterium]|nr:flagellar protein FlgN [Lachnospiraceae bacterium]MBP5746664.1 flagellar protein FlgN [Lachnospiraceae bacterium]